MRMCQGLILEEFERVGGSHWLGGLKDMFVGL